MISYLDMITIDLKNKTSCSISTAWQNYVGDYGNSWLGKGIRFIGSCTPLYIAPEVVEKVRCLEAQIAALSATPEEPESLLGRLKTFKKDPLYALAKGASFEQAFPRRVETVESLMKGSSGEKLGHFNSYRNTNYSYEKANEVFKAALDKPFAHLLSNEEQLSYQRILSARVIKGAVKGYEDMTRDELLRKVTLERDNLFARNGIIPTAGYFLATGISFVNPLGAFVVSAASLTLQTRHRREASDLLAAASLLSGPTGLTSAVTPVLVNLAPLAGVIVLIEAVQNKAPPEEIERATGESLPRL